MALPLYLSFKEIIRNRGRFLLIGMVIALITTLVLFVAALAEGLGAGNREYISKLDAQLIVFQEKSDLSISASRIGRSSLNDIRRLEGVADAGAIGFSAVTIILPDQSTLDVSLIGVEPNRPGVPPVQDGRTFVSDRSKEAIIDSNVVLRTGLAVGDRFTVKVVQGAREELYPLTVVGISDGQQYSLQPSVFVPFFAWERIKPRAAAETGQAELTANIVAVRLIDPEAVNAMSALLEARVSKIETASLVKTYESTPGYSAQQSTLNTQQVFTLLIGVLVIGGFFQIQTLQKVAQIGMLKAIGSSNKTVAIAAVVQIVMVTLLGVGIGGVGTWALSLGFPPTVPIIFTGRAVAVAIASLLLIGPLGGLLSIRYALNVEPLKALGLAA